ncbi:MAG: hypothetical protein ACMG6E_02630 [Candidatus Roizmanbacteria bacterium]
MDEDTLDTTPSHSNDLLRKTTPDGAIIWTDRVGVELQYACTNERIEAVLAGFGTQIQLLPQRILAIGGSGDIPFALLPYVKELIVVDSNSAQISLIRRRVELLRRKDFHTFLHEDIKGKRDDDLRRGRDARMRFFQPDLLDRTSIFLDRLKILDPCDILTGLGLIPGPYTGIYASNILGILPNGKDQIPKYIESFESNLSDQGLLYVADGDQIEKLGIRLSIDSNLTNDARKFGTNVAGLPAVHRKSIFQR